MTQTRSVVVKGWAVTGALLLMSSSAWGQQVFIYPQKGQTPQQQAQDTGECQGWATAADRRPHGRRAAVRAAAAHRQPDARRGARRGGRRGRRGDRRATRARARPSARRAAP